MLVISLCGLKGGVGKTTAAVNLATLAAQEAGRTILWDLDPQAASTLQLTSGQAPSLRPKRLLKGSATVKEAAIPTRVSGLELVPAGMGMRRMDTLLERQKGGVGVLHEALRSLRHTYRWVFLDCPPGLSRLVAFLERTGRTQARLVPFFSLVESRSRIQRELMETLRSREPALCRTVILKRAEVEAASARRRPLVIARPRSFSADAYRRLWEEIHAALRPEPEPG